MASELATQPSDLKPIHPISPVSSGTMGTTQNLGSMQPHDRGRRRSRSPENDGGGQDGKADDINDGPNGASFNPDGPGPARKRRRSRKGLDKRFECSAEGCGKSYSRAEHLYRHQLNHNSKQTYHCNFPNCTRIFVRGDLLKRHMDRHAAKGSQLNQGDSMAGRIALFLAPGSNSLEFNRNSMDYSKPRPSHMQYQAPQDPSRGPYSPMSTPQGMFANGDLPNGMDAHGAQNQGFENRPPQLSQPHSPPVSQRQSMPTNATSVGVMSPIANQPGFPKSQNNMPQSSSFVSQQNVMPINLPPLQFSRRMKRDNHMAPLPLPNNRSQGLLRAVSSAQSTEAITREEKTKEERMGPGAGGFEM